MTYDELLIAADEEGLIVKEVPLHSGDGGCRGRRIAIRQDIPTLKKKADVLAEEMGHYHTTVGRIIEQDSVMARKQEREARLWAYKVQLPLLDIVRACQAHCSNMVEMSEYLNISEDTIRDALELYRQKYGRGTSVLGDYYIQFEPYLDVFEYYKFN